MQLRDANTTVFRRKYQNETMKNQIRALHKLKSELEEQALTLLLQNLSEKKAIRKAKKVYHKD